MNFLAVYRVNWLRARAQKNRWEEEILLTQYEMKWVVNYFNHMALKWRSRCNVWTGVPLADGRVARGHQAYAEKQIAMWNELGRVSDITFKLNCPHSISTWNMVL